LIGFDENGNTLDYSSIYWVKTVIFYSIEPLSFL